MNKKEVFRAFLGKKGLFIQIKIKNLSLTNSSFIIHHSSFPEPAVFGKGARSEFNSGCLEIGQAMGWVRLLASPLSAHNAAVQF